MYSVFLILFLKPVLVGAEFIVSDLAGSCVESSEWSKRKNLGIKVIIRCNGSEVVFRVI